MIIFLCCSYIVLSLAEEKKKSPTVAEMQAESATGPKARIAVAQFVNNSGGFEAQIQRTSVQMQAQMANLAQQQMEYQKKMMPYWQEFAVWQAKVAEVGQEEAGPPPEMPEFDSVSSSPYNVTVTDPVAGGVRDMLINALVNSGKYIVLERQELNKISWEQEFSQSGHVGEETKIPLGEIEGAELIVIGSLNTLDTKQSGGNIGGLISSVTSATSYTNEPIIKEATDANITWEKALVGMDIRLVDTRTSRIVAATAVEGKATSVGFDAARTKYSYNAGDLPLGFSVYKNTPVEDAFRKAVDSAVNFILQQTPETYYHRQPEQSEAIENTQVDSESEKAKLSEESEQSE